MPVTTQVVPLTLAAADALLVDGGEFATRFGMALAPGSLDAPEVLPAARSALAAGAPPEWGSHLIVHRETLTVVGFGGFKGPPVAGEVEIGYSVAPAHRGRGHATATVAELVRRAAAGGAARVVAHTVAEESTSTRILVRAGFVRTDDVVDEEIGDVWRWELSLRDR